MAAELADVSSEDDITVLRHVRASTEKRVVQGVADRKPCEDFDAFKPLFEQVRNDLSSGLRVTRPFGQYATIEVGHWFIPDGQTAYVSEEGEEFDSPQGKKDARLRVIYSNGTESNLLRLSLVRALYKDETARRITDPDMGPLFSDALEESDLESGTIYVLRSLSDNPYVAEHRDVIHKIGVTGGKVETRIANAEHDSTYLLAKVEVVASYKLAGINRTRMENLFHRLFAPARLNITINDRFGHPVQPEEWFLVPLFVIDEAVARIKDGSIIGYVYDPMSAKLVKQWPLGVSVPGRRQPSAALSILSSSRRNSKAAYQFLGKILNNVKKWPRFINTDKAPAYGRALALLKREGRCPSDVEHRQIKYRNNVIECDHAN